MIGVVGAATAKIISVKYDHTKILLGSHVMIGICMGLIGHFIDEKKEFMVIAFMAFG